MPIASTISRSRASKIASSPNLKASSSSTLTSQKRSHSQTKRDHHSVQMTSSSDIKDDNKISDDANHTGGTRLNRGRLRRANSSNPVQSSPSSVGKEHQQQLSLENEDGKPQKQINLFEFEKISYF